MLPSVATSGAEAPYGTEFQVIVLAGGAGTNLFPLNSVPKPLIPLSTRPLLWYVLSLLEEQGFSSVIVLTRSDAQKDVRKFVASHFPSSRKTAAANQLAEAEKKDDKPRKKSTFSPTGDRRVSNFVGGGLEFKVEVEAYPIEEYGGDETPGSFTVLRHIRNKITTDFFVLSCDFVGYPNLHQIADVHRVEDCACTMLLVRNQSKTSEKGKGSDQKQKETQEMLVGLDETRKQVLLLQSGLDAHTSGLGLEKLKLFRHPLCHIDKDLTDIHCYLFKYSVLSLLDHPDLDLSSISEDLMTHLIQCQEMPSSEGWSVSRLACDKFSELHENEIKRDAGPLYNASGGLHSQGSILNSPPTFYAASPPAEVKGTRVMCVIESSDDLGLCQRVDSLQSYISAHHRLLDNPLLLPDWVVPPRVAKSLMANPMIARDNVILPGLQAASNAVIKKSFFGNNCTVGQSVKITHCVVHDNVTIKGSCVLEGCVLAEGCVIETGTQMKSCMVAHGVTVLPNDDDKQWCQESFTAETTAELFGQA